MNIATIAKTAGKFVSNLNISRARHGGHPAGTEVAVRWWLGSGTIRQFGRRADCKILLGGYFLNGPFRMKININIFCTQ